MEFFSKDNIFFTVLNYPLSHIEFWAVIFGISAVILAARSKIINWPIGLVNIVLSFSFYYQIQLYSDMLLQTYYFFTGIYGWYLWSNQKGRSDVKITKLTRNGRIIVAISTILGTLVIGYFISQIHIYFSGIFPQPASYPYIDTFVAILSIFGNLQLAEAIWENWILWILVNIICVWMYFQKGALLFSFEYLIFLGIAIYGLYTWTLKFNEQNRVSNI